MRSIISYLSMTNDAKDWTQALRKAIADSIQYKCESIYFPPGKYNFYEEIEIPNGINLIGDGCVGTNLDQGTVLVDNSSADNFLVFSGKSAYRGGGGGVHNLTIAKGFGLKGGNAIAFSGTSPHQRAGFVDINRVNVYTGSDTGRFNIGLVINGNAIQIKGSAGVRDITFNMFISGCVVCAAYILNGVHAYGVLQTAPAGGNGNVIIGGGSEDIQIYAGRIYGDLIVNESKEVRFLGVASSKLISQYAEKFVSL